MNDEKKYYKLNIDEKKSILNLTEYNDTLKTHKLYYKLSDSIYSFKGIFGNDTIQANTNRKTETDFLLMNRGFHWINEYPFNR
ncbi:MAG: hypothetical protein WBF67_05045 [Olleya sp.]